MSRIKTFIILIIVFLIIGGYLYYKWGKESFMPSNEHIIALNLEKVGKPIYIKARNWGVAGNHEEIVLSMSNKNISNKDSDYIFYSNDVFYKTDSIQTITFFVPESSISEPLIKFTNPLVIINKLKNADEIEDYVQNYQKYGLKRITFVNN